MESFGKHQVTLGLIVQDVLYVSCAGLVLGRNDFVKLVYDTISSGDVTIPWVNRTILVKIYCIVLILAIHADGQFVIIYVGQRELCIFFSSQRGNKGDRKPLFFHIITVDDRVEHNHLTN